MGWWTRPTVLAVAATSLAVAGCSGGGETAPTTTPSTIAITTTTISLHPADGTLSIGAFLPRTGPGAALGGPMISAVQQAVDEINVAGGVLGQRVDFKIQDESAGTGLEELLATGVDAIVGPASSTVALSELSDAVNPTTGVVTCSPTASALALDDYPDNNLFFRTIPSDSFQMSAIEYEVEGTGVESVAVGYLDDPYGRALKDVLVAQIRAANEVTLQTEQGFEADLQELDAVAGNLLAGRPGVVVVLGDADDGTRLLQALDAATLGGTPPLIVVNDAIRDGRQAISSLSAGFRSNIRGVGPLATSRIVPGPEGYFSANAVDCVNLIALAAIQAGSDDPAEIKKNMASVSAGGQVCTSFADCAERLAQGLSIDYSGYSGDVELSATSGDRTKAWFQAFNFNPDGEDQDFEGPFELTTDR